MTCEIFPVAGMSFGSSRRFVYLSIWWTAFPSRATRALRRQGAEIVHARWDGASGGEARIGRWVAPRHVRANPGAKPRRDDHTLRSGGPNGPRMRSVNASRGGGAV